MILTKNVRDIGTGNAYRKLKMPRKRLKSTPENIAMSEALKKEAGTLSAITQGHKCPVCNSWILRKNKGICMPCYIKKKANG
jgi:hypothetical protein